jgi:hypothetical protein
VTHAQRWEKLRYRARQAAVRQHQRHVSGVRHARECLRVLRGGLRVLLRGGLRVLRVLCVVRVLRSFLVCPRGGPRDLRGCASTAILRSAVPPPQEVLPIKRRLRPPPPPRRRRRTRGAAARPRRGSLEACKRRLYPTRAHSCCPARSRRRETPRRAGQPAAGAAPAPRSRARQRRA